MSSPVMDLAELVRPVASIKIYNPSEHVVHRNYQAESYDIPPGVSDLAPIGRATLQALMLHFFGDDGRSGHASGAGVRPLFGDKRDEAVIAEADAAYAESKYQSCLQLKLAHIARVMKEKESNLPVSPPDAKIRAAMEYVAAVDRGRGLIGAVSCPHCAWALESKIDLRNHVYTMHPESFDPNDYEDETEPGQASPKRKPRAKKQS